MPHNPLPRRKARIAFLCAAFADVTCCSNVDDIVREEDVEGTIEGQMLLEVRAASASESDRCRSACDALFQQKFEDAVLEDFIGCMADGDVLDDPAFDTSNNAVYVYCVAVLNFGPGYCT